MNRLKEKRTARRQQNTRLINEAKAVLDTADIGELASLRERLQANNDELERLKSTSRTKRSQRKWRLY